MKQFGNEQHFDWEGLKGVLLSTSYMPWEDHPQFGPMIDSLRRLFDAHQQNGLVSFEYDTKMYYGQL